ncbi:hypothetical protein V5799_023900 [Amblyomma americanum]|uniref:Uncharacterized protein n=1 Tax=Amblyomma americanum TaxID=6943 RepID=A0AAQ4FHS0_AMBAM
MTMRSTNVHLKRIVTNFGPGSDNSAFDCREPSDSTSHVLYTSNLKCSVFSVFFILLAPENFTRRRIRASYLCVCPIYYLLFYLSILLAGGRYRVIDKS